MVDKYELVPEFLKVKGLVQNQLDSFNYFVRTKLKKIVLANPEIRSTRDPAMYLRYMDVRIGKISSYGTKRKSPQICRLSDSSYVAPIVVHVEYTMETNSGIVVKEKDVIIGSMPIMLRSCCCLLYEKDEEQLARLGECPLDPGGYFVIKGTEKVLLIQEQLAKNQLIVDFDKKGCVRASVASNTEKNVSTSIMKMEDDKIYIELRQFKCKVPIMIIMKALGIQSDQEVLQMIGRDPRFGALLLPSIEECGALKVYTQEQALKFLERDEMLEVSDSTGPVKKRGRALSILRDIFLGNIPVHQNNLHKKCIYVVVLLRRMMEAILNKSAVDDKDYLGNKRYELSGQLLSLLFEDLFKRMNDEARKTVDACLAKKKRRYVDFSRFIVGKTITVGLERSLSTGNWDIKGTRMHSLGTTQVVSRLSYIGMLDQMTRITSQFYKSRKVQGSQWGMICPIDTPVGEACGLVKHLALMTHVTLPTDEDESDMASLCYTLGVEDLEQLSPELHNSGSYLIILNGRFLGKHRFPQKFANAMRKLRRKGRIDEFVSIFVNEKQGCVYIASDGGRVCRPLVIADKGVSRIKKNHMEELRDGVRDFIGFLRDGLVEYLDVNEENNSLIALCERETTQETTHVEIEPFAILGVCAGLIPYLDSNELRSNTYQCAMGKQAMGNIAYNQLRRMDTLINLLVYPQRPLLTTRTIDLVGYDKLGAGQNAIVAVMSYSGYDTEEAIVMNKSSLVRDFGRCIVMKTYSDLCQRYENGTSDRIIKAERIEILDDDGIASPGEIIRPYDIYINKEAPIEKRTWLPDSAYKLNRQIYKGPEGETAVVDRVALYTDEENRLCIKLMTRHTRRPEIGDKFSCRHGHKGVCGLIVQQEDFPFSERGICPDITINPHAFQKQMTLGKLKELHGSKAGAESGKFHYGTAFSETSDHVEAISNTLVARGCSYHGKDLLYSGTNGMPLQAYIFMGPIYYQKQKQMVMDKMKGQRTNRRNIVTRQLTEGIRVGEMERDCLVSYGASSLIHERLMISGDPYEAQVCRKCGLLGYYNYKLKMGICSMCQNGENITTLKMPYAFKLLIQELQSMNVVMRLNLAED